MILPSIDLQGGRAVQLIGGREKALDGGDPLEVAERFALVGEIAVVDLDAAMGIGSNAGVMRELVRRFPCRVGGGIRSAEAALDWLDRGATAVVLGTAATPEVLSRLPKNRAIAALDARDGEIVVEGWTTGTGRKIDERIDELVPLVGGFLVTFVEREGRMAGADVVAARGLADRMKPARLTFAGGITTPDEVAALDRAGVDAQVGMALYTGRLPLAAAFAAPLTSDRSDGLWPTVVADASGTALGLAYSNAESLARAIETRRGVYHSRARGLWIKGESSGDAQTLLRVEVDCDRDALLFTVEQGGQGFCHERRWRCFGADRGLGALDRRLQERLRSEDAASFTRRLLADPALLRGKLLEEAAELADAASPDEVAWEAADLIYFALVAARRAGVSLADIEAEMDRRGRRVLRTKRQPGE